MTRITAAISAGLLVLAFGAGLSSQGAPTRTPRLPDPPFRYANIELPPHFETARTLDNTPRLNRITDAGATLGRVLFYDTQLSANGTTACASCHQQQYAFADPKRFSVGFEGRQTDRHAPNLTGLRYYVRARFFWDERRGNLEDMVLLPIGNPIEMGEDLPRLPRKLAGVAYYPALFRLAFGDPAVTERRIARALAQFLRSLVSYRSRYDHGVAQAASLMAPFANFTRDENHGKALFVRSCARCHRPADDETFFGRVPADNGAERPMRSDGGLGDLTLNAQDFGHFKSPSLRNVEVAGPYMHDGSAATLDDVIEHYSRNVPPRAPLDFTDSEKRALVAFLKTLTDHEFLNDPRFSDPFTPSAAGERPAREPAPRGPALPVLPGPGIPEVIARLMAFDRTADDHLVRDELPERMHDLVARGDRNRSGGLDRDELRMLVSSEARPGRGIPLSRVAVNLRPAPDATVETLLGDLGLDAATRDAALAALARDRDERLRAVAASVERFREELRGAVDAQPLVALTSVLEQELRGPVRVSSQGSVPVLLPAAAADRAIDSSRLPPPAHAAVRAAVAAHRQRIGLLATNPDALLRRFEPILSPGELSDLRAKIRRHRPLLLSSAPRT